MKPSCRLFAIALLTVALGCSGSNNDNNADPATNNANNSGADAGNNNSEDVDNTGLEYAAEYETIFDTLAFGNQPANQLNTLVANNLDTSLEFPIIVLLELDEIDADAGTLIVRGGSGVKTDDPEVFEWDTFDGTQGEPESTEGTLDPASGEFAASLEYFGFVATFKFENDVSKTILPINELAIEGQLVLESDGSTGRVANGELEGYITKEDGDETEITLTPGGSPISLTQIFKESTLNYDTASGEEVEKGTGDAWFVTGTYTAASTTIDD